MADYTILLVDYDPRSIERLRSPLEREGYRVEVAKNGQEGISKFHALKPAAVIIEAMLPKRHGFEVCQELKKTEHGASCPVMIATSVYKGRKYRHQAMHMYSCDAYLEKPLADDDLINVVATALQNYAEARKKAESEALEIDESLLRDEVHVPPQGSGAPRVTAATEIGRGPTVHSKSTESKAAPRGEEGETEIEILDRLDSIFGKDSGS